MKYVFSYSKTILKALENISRWQGEIDGLPLGFQTADDLYQNAAIDSIYFSSKLEGNSLTLKQVTAALTENKIKSAHPRDLNEVLNYGKLRKFVEDSSFAFDSKNLLTCHDYLLRNILIKSMRGKLRTAQNVIRDSQDKGIVYLPPSHEDVKDLTDRLLRWLRVEMKKDDVSCLLLSGLFHFQFESIHPFMDGNGRIGRVWAHAILYHSKYSFVSLAAIEKYHEQNRNQYYDLLHRFQGNLFYNIRPDQDLTPWLEYWVSGLEFSCREALSRLKDRLGRTSIEDPVAPLLEGRRNKALAYFQKFKQLKAKEYQDLMDIARTQAVSDLNQMVQAGYIVRQGGGRSTLYRLKP